MKTSVVLSLALLCTVNCYATDWRSNYERTSYAPQWRPQNVRERETDTVDEASEQNTVNRSNQATAPENHTETSVAAAAKTPEESCDTFFTYFKELKTVQEKYVEWEKAKCASSCTTDALSSNRPGITPTAADALKQKNLEDAALKARKNLEIAMVAAANNLLLQTCQSSAFNQHNQSLLKHSYLTIALVKPQE